MDFCKNFNAKTAKDDGLIIPVVVTIYADRSYTFITKTPPASVLLKKVANLAKGSAEPNRNKVGTVTAKQVEDIAKQKMPDLNCTDLAVGGEDRARHGAVDGDRCHRIDADESTAHDSETPIAQASRESEVGSSQSTWEAAKRSVSTTRRHMAKHGKKFTAAAAQVEDRPYSIEEAIPLIQKVKYAKFDETVEVAMRLGVDPKHADQMVRGTVVLPHGLGKSKRVLAIAGADKQKEAQDAGADFVGGDEVVEKILGGWMDFDAVVATPDMMRAVGRLGKVLGPRGLMPNPKTGTVTPNVAQAIKEIKAGKVEFRVDKTGIIHAPVGKTSFPAQNLIDNAHALVDSVVKAKPSAAKGKYLKSVTVSSTMGPGVAIDTAHIDERAEGTRGSDGCHQS